MDSNKDIKQHEDIVHKANDKKGMPELLLLHSP